MGMNLDRTPPRLPIRRSKTSCERCRKLKRKCEARGSSCERCTRLELPCTLSETEPTPLLSSEDDVRLYANLQSDLNVISFSRLNFAQPPPREQTSLVFTAVNRGWMETYYWRINFTQMFYGGTPQMYENTTSPALHLQYYAAMASVARSTESDLSIVAYYENRAKLITSDMAKEASIDLMKGLQLLSFHYWGQDAGQSEFFRRSVILMGIALARRSPLSFSDSQQLLQIVLGAVGAQYLNSPQCGSVLKWVLEEFADLIMTITLAEDALTSLNNSLSIRRTIQWLRMRANFSDCVNRSPDIEAPVFTGLMEDANRLRSSVIATESFIRPFQSSGIVASTLMRGVMIASLDTLEESIEILWQAVRSYWEDQRVIFAVSVPILLHLGFRIAIAFKDFMLASWLSKIQLSLSEQFTVARQMYEEESSYLNRIFAPPSLPRTISPVYSHHVTMASPSVVQYPYPSSLGIVSSLSAEVRSPDFPETGQTTRSSFSHETFPPFTICNAHMNPSVPAAFFPS